MSTVPSTTTPAQTRRAAYTSGLRALADLLDATPDLPLPDVENFAWNIWWADDAAAEVARIRRLLPGQFDKNEPTNAYDGKYFILTGDLGGIPVEICTYREQVCRKVVTGQREVTKEIPTSVETVTVTEDVVEWVCEPLLAKAASA